MELVSVGHVESSLRDRDDAPKQGDEGAPEAWLVIAPEFVAALDGIATGDELLLMYASANRDEAVFDAPERFDVGREPNPHVAFGFGTHFCLGAALARLEIRVMFEELLPRLRGLRLAPAVAPERIPNAFVRGFRSLHVEYTSA